MSLTPKYGDIHERNLKLLSISCSCSLVFDLTDFDEICLINVGF